MSNPIFSVKCGTPPPGTNTLRKWLVWRQEEDLRMFAEVMRLTLLHAELRQAEPADDTQWQ
jgi:hypothetical protein